MGVEADFLHQFLCNLVIQCRALGEFIVVPDRLTEAGRFRQLDVAGNCGIENFSCVIFFQLVHNLGGKIQTTVVHGDQNTRQLQCGIEALFDLFYAEHQLGQTFQ